jgi:hypothetical protein
LLDLLFNAVVGMVFALCARDRVRADGPFAAPAFLLVMSFVGLIVVPIGLYLYLAHPAWTWMYLVDPREVPALAAIPFAVIHGGALIAAWYAAARLIRVNRQRLVAYLIGGGLAALLLASLLLRHRLLSYGTYAEFRRGTTLALMDVKLGYVLVTLVLGVGAALGFVALELFRDSRRVRAR